MDLPALLLVAVMSFMFYALYRVQRNPANNFDFADMFRDESGKPSAARIMVLVCGGVTSWLLMYMVMHSVDSRVDPMFFGLYLTAWSGTALASKWMDLKAGGQLTMKADMSVESRVEKTSEVKVTTTKQTPPSDPPEDEDPRAAEARLVAEKRAEKKQ